MRHVVGGIHGEFSPKHGSVQITLLIYYLRSLHLKIFIRWRTVARFSENSVGITDLPAGSPVEEKEERFLLRNVACLWWPDRPLISAPSLVVSCIKHAGAPTLKGL